MDKVNLEKVRHQIAHDLREPVLRMKTLLSLMQSSGENEIKSEYIPVLEKSLSQMEERIEAILSML